MQHAPIVLDVVAGERGEGRQPGGAAAAEGLDPVSYTHLRAHETVLDIVCRLLLEKKKNNYTLLPKLLHLLLDCFF
mgnify:CR=1 FL=1